MTATEQVEWKNLVAAGEPSSVPAVAQPAQVEQAGQGMSTKKKVIIGSLVGAAIAGAVAACLKSDGCGSGSSAGSSQSMFPNTTELLLFGGPKPHCLLGLSELLRV
jgi:hypothetical protein